jgi:hypothetical protein
LTRSLSAWSLSTWWLLAQLGASVWQNSHRLRWPSVPDQYRGRRGSIVSDGRASNAIRVFPFALGERHTLLEHFGRRFGSVGDSGAVVGGHVQILAIGERTSAHLVSDLLIPGLAVSDLSVGNLSVSDRHLPVSDLVVDVTSVDLAIGKLAIGKLAGGKLAGGAVGELPIHGLAVVGLAIIGLAKTGLADVGLVLRELLAVDSIGS